MRERSPRCGEAVVWITVEVHVEDAAAAQPEDDAHQLDLWEDPTDAAGPLQQQGPHPPGGTHWQRVINRYPPGVPLIFGRPEA